MAHSCMFYDFLWAALSVLFHMSLQIYQASFEQPYATNS